jgi:hypothetical protein
VSEAPYQLEFTPEYSRELGEIEAHTGHLDQSLRQTVYRVLEWAPHDGWLSQRSGLWIIRRNVLAPLLQLQIAYRIDEARRVVELVAVRSVDTTTL